MYGLLEYRTHTKFRDINFHVLVGSEFRASIFSCGVIFVDTYVVIHSDSG